MPSPEPRDGAEGAAVVAPFAHPQVCPVPRRQAVPVRLVSEAHCGLAHL